MTHEELRDHYDLYAIGVSGEPEREEIREHLERGCEVCMAELKRARATTAWLLTSVPEASPSPKLRRRILASVGLEQRSFLWTPLLAAATVLSLVAAVYFSGREKEFAGQVARLSDQMRRQNVELTRLNEAFAILNSPSTMEASFGQGEPRPPKGRVFVNPRGVLLIASSLPPAASGKTYEMWTIPKGGGAPVPAGTFQAETDNTAMHMYHASIDPAAVSAVAVTVENEGGAAQPTLPVLFAAPML